MQHGVHMIAHDSIGIEPHGEAFRQGQQAFFYPSFAVLIRTPTISVLSAEEGAPDTARNAVEVARYFWGNHLKAWVCHVHTLRIVVGRAYQSTAHGTAGGGPISGCPRSVLQICPSSWRRPCWPHAGRAHPVRFRMGKSCYEHSRLRTDAARISVTSRRRCQQRRTRGTVCPSIRRHALNSVSGCSLHWRHRLKWWRCKQ